MPIILVVDDSEVDRRLVGGLLSKDIDWLVEFADNGVEALERMNTTSPDLVITDMMMPEMDGMELVTNIRIDHPEVPVILVTGHGSESLAVEALEKGAASYVPKSELSDRLLETVEQVLSLVKADRSYSRLIERLRLTSYKFDLDNDPFLISPLVDLLQQMLMGLRICASTERMHCGVALEEALLNAMLHGNLEMPADQVQKARAYLREGKLSPLVEQRCGHTPYSERSVTVEASIGRGGARFLIRDQGRGFDTSKVPQRGDPATLENSNGRGLILMRNFMDEVKFNDSGNEVIMTKRP